MYKKTPVLINRTGDSSCGATYIHPRRNALSHVLSYMFHMITDGCRRPYIGGAPNSVCPRKSIHLKQYYRDSTIHDSLEI